MRVSSARVSMVFHYHTYYLFIYFTFFLAKHIHNLENLSDVVYSSNLMRYVSKFVFLMLFQHFVCLPACLLNGLDCHHILLEFDVGSSPCSVFFGFPFPAENTSTDL